MTLVTILIILLNNKGTLPLFLIPYSSSSTLLEHYRIQRDDIIIINKVAGLSIEFSPTTILGEI